MDKRLLHNAGKLALIAAILASGLHLAPPADAKNNGKGKGQGQEMAHKNDKRDKDFKDNDAFERSFWRSDRDRDRFRDWLNRYQGHRYTTDYDVPASVLVRNRITRAEFEALPPGIQKNVMRGKSIPPGLRPGHRLDRDQLGRINPIADSILDSLGLPRDRYDYHDGRRVGRYGDDAIIYNPASGIIFDILRGVF